MKKNVHSPSGHFLYSVGTVPSALPYNMIQSYLVTFYSVYVGLDLALCGLLLILYGIWNAINDPLISFYIDHKKLKRGGRRVPYIIFGTIPLTIGFMLLWWVPFSTQLAIFLYAFLMLFLFDTGFTFAMTAYSALYTEMYEDEDERAKVCAIKDLIAFLSSMMGILLPPLLASILGGWGMVGIIFGLINPLTIYICLFGIEERKEYQIDEPLPFGKAFKETIKNKAFINITLTYTVIDFIFGLTMMVLPLYALFILKTDEAMMGFAALGVAIGIIASIPVWRHIYAKKGPKYGLWVAILIFTLGIAPIGFLSNFWMLTVFTVLPGFGCGGMLMTEPAISAAIDSDEIITNHRREATFSGIMSFVARLSLVFSGITLMIMQYTTGLDTDAPIQTESALFGLRALVSLVPVLGGLLALLIFGFFPLNLKAFNIQQIKLKQLHEERLKKIQK